MADVAARASVSLKTVYLAFETKAGLLLALWHRLLRGDLEDVAVGEQAWFREVLDEPDPVRQLELNARNSLVVKARAGAIMATIRAAAPGDPEIGSLWSRIQTEFHANQRAVVASLADKGALDPRLDVDTGADILWALNHPSLYELLVGERGWTLDRYEAWLAEIFRTELLGRVLTLHEVGAYGPGAEELRQLRELGEPARVPRGPVRVVAVDDAVDDVMRLGRLV